jgi:hypothetical protein
MSLVGSSAKVAAGISKMEAVKFRLAKALTLNLLPFSCEILHAKSVTYWIS